MSLSCSFNLSRMDLPVSPAVYTVGRDLFQLRFSFFHGRCLCLGYTSAAFSAGRIVIVSCCFRFLKAFCISFVMLGLGGLAC